MNVLALCHTSGVWPAAFSRMGVQVDCVDVLNGGDVRLLHSRPKRYDGIIAEPPCTDLAGSGARWWASKGQGALLNALSIVDACLRAVVIYDPAWWILENPVGRLCRYLGKPAFTFNPNEFAGWADDPGSEAYTKKTCIWGGRFVMPVKNSVFPTLGSKMHKLPPSPNRAALRSVTPQGFARAFAYANCSVSESRAA